MRTNELSVVVAGAGVAGPALAVGLQAAGVSCRLLEARRGGGDGAFLAVAPNGLRALDALGLGGVLERTSALALDGITFRSTAGQQIGRAPESDPGTRTRLVRRADLHEILLDAARDAGATVEHGARVVDATEDADGVTAVLADGTSERGDVLVGADGVRSTVRQRCLPGSPAPRWSGLVDCGGWAQVDLPDTDSQQMVFGRRGFIGYVVADGTAWWFANLHRDREPGRDELARLAAGAVLDELRELHADDGPVVGALLDRAQAVEGVWPVLDLDPLPTWHTDRVVVAGDAAHAAGPSAGQGASLAIEDAAVLAACLRQATGTPRDALARFELLRRARTEAVVRQGRRLGSTKMPSGLSAHARDVLLPLFLRLGAARSRRLSTYPIQDVVASAAAADGARR